MSQHLENIPRLHLVKYNTVKNYFVRGGPVFRRRQKVVIVLFSNVDTIGFYFNFKCNLLLSAIFYLAFLKLLQSSLSVYTNRTSRYNNSTNVDDSQAEYSMYCY